MKTDRLDAELGLLRAAYERVEHWEDGDWILIAPYSVPPGWTLTEVECVFKVPVGYPGAPPYGFYVPRSLQHSSKGSLGNYQAAPSPAPPFPGEWAMFSWGQRPGGWLPGSTVRNGSNLLNYARTFADRLREGA